MAELHSSGEFPGGVVPTEAFVKANRIISRTVKNRGFLAIVGDTGLGKSTVLEKGVGKYSETPNKYLVIRVKNFVRYHDFIGSIMSLMIRRIAGESPVNDMTARSIQLDRVLRQCARERTIILAIDEAQDMHPDALYGLKKLHELGRESGSAFPIILFGKDDLLKKIEARELRWRIVEHRMGQVSEEEARDFLKLWGVTITGEKAFERFFSHFGVNPAAIKHFADTVTANANAEKVQATDEMVRYAIAGDQRQECKELGISLSDIVDAVEQEFGIRIDRSTASKATSGELASKLADQVRASTASLIQQKRQKTSVSAAS